ncbi:hypothetical protein GALL_528560 [mine drainage metagenome]|uniref:Uncharacterized protein n=1 Tax=mine drainage metagenome TaxID=410659 RepID=A0A1J5P208_9ZZZZ
MRGAEAEHQRTHRADFRQAELEADREHQEHDSELGQVLRRRLVVAGGQAQRVGPNQHADREITEQRRQLQQAEHDDAEHRGDQVHQDEFESGHRGSHAQLQASPRHELGHAGTA